MCSVWVWREFLMVCHLFLPQLPQTFCILRGLRSVFMWDLTDWEQTSFSWQLTFESSPLRPLAIVRELRVDDKSFPVLSLSCARGSVPQSACHRRMVSLWTDSKSIHHYRIIQCGDVSACAHSEALKPSFNCWEKVSNENRSTHTMELSPDPASLPWSEIWRHFIRETRSVRYEFCVDDCSAFPSTATRPEPSHLIEFQLGQEDIGGEINSLFCGGGQSTVLHARKTHRKFGLGGKPVLQFMM